MELSTEEVAGILGISQSEVVRLVDEGNIPTDKVGTGRRLSVPDVLAYKARRDAQLAGVDAIAAADLTAGVPYH